jgi:hypothetical protein
VCLCSLIYSATPDQLTAYSSAIDNVLEKQYVAAKIQPKPVIDDDTFVRRAYLSIIGRNPTYNEYELFNKANVANKRIELIKFLVKHPGNVSHMFNFWADSLRLRDRLNNINNFSGGPYIDYIKDCLTANKPYNTFVKDLLTATGSYYDNPATGYYYRDLGMPLDNLIGTGKVFLGTDIGCAQCHDDPFQEFSQMQFYKLAAMFNQVELRDRNNKEFKEKAKVLRDEIENLIKSDPVKFRGLNNQVNNFLRATQASLEITPTKQLKLPHDYKYPDAKPLTVVEPAVLNGTEEINHKDDMRVDAVEWFVNPKHPTFTKNIVNRYWKLVFGKYIIDTYDNIQDDPLLNSELINVLAKIMIELNYDSKQFLYVLYTTKLFQRELYDGIYSNSQNFIFIAPVKQRLSAEQLWDSVLAIAVETPESFKHTFQDEYSKLMHVADAELTLDGVKKKMEEYQKIIRTKYDTAPKLRNFVMARASEINDANPVNSILEQLGRSDRELIDTSSKEGSVTQVISFMNGQLADLAINKDTVLIKNLANKSPTEKIEIIFKSILARKPSVSEKSTFAGVEDDDIIWALINSSEYKFSK